MPGAGKSTIGRALARRLGKDFHDTDTEIKARTGVRIPVIFEIEGEPGFRRRESDVLERMTRMENIVLATGGGVVLDAGNRAALKSRGFVLYLYALPRELWRRTRHDKSRPLLQADDQRARMEELFEKRDPLYRETADLIIETGRQSVSALVAELLPRIEKACAPSS
ncbi:MAG: shikimate kinase [Betaproteobacteria bacterium]|nr:shikimate kinase [Betaproteobacteria bacterium]